MSTEIVNIVSSNTGSTATVVGDGVLPTTTKGDIIVFNGAMNVRGTVGSDGKSLVANSASANGVDYFDVGSRLLTASGRYLVPRSFATVSVATITSAIIYFTPIIIYTPQTFTAVGFAPVVTTTTNYKTGVYADLNGKPTGTVIAGTTATTGPITVASVTGEDGTFSSPLALNPGKYWLAILADTTGTANNLSSTGQSGELGSTDMTASNGTYRLSFAQAYANGLVDVTGQSFTNTATTPFYLGLKAQ